MAPKKMSLEEFINDEEFGGSWADEPVDYASISVPIDHHKTYQHNDDFMGGNKFNSYNNNPHLDNGPPYIVKILNLPISVDDLFIEDLFKSRYTNFIKCKIVVDPASNVLESHIIKKVSFVELNNFQDLQKVIKWHDLYYGGGKRVIIETADFYDFQNCINFNKEHESVLQQIEQDVLSGKLKPNHGYRNNDHYTPPHHHSNNNNINNNFQHQHQNQHNNFGPSLGSGFGSGPGSNSVPGSAVSGGSNSHPAHKPKPNPFGAAKPVDVLARLQEIDKKLITINHTTVRTIGSSEFDKNDHPHPHWNDSNKSPHDASNGGGDSNQDIISTTPTVTNPYKQNGGLSLAELLTNKPKDNEVKKDSPKPSIVKPIILKKKPKSEKPIEDKKDDEVLAEKVEEMKIDKVEKVKVDKIEEGDKLDTVKADKPKINKADKVNKAKTDKVKVEKPKVNRKADKVEEPKDFKEETAKDSISKDPVPQEKSESSTPVQELNKNGEAKKFNKFEKSDKFDKFNNKIDNRNKNFKSFKDSEALLNSGKNNPLDNSDRPNFKKQFDEMNKGTYLSKKKYSNGNFHGFNKDYKPRREFNKDFKSLDRNFDKNLEKEVKDKEKVEKPEKLEKSDKVENVEKPKVEKTEKLEKPEKVENVDKVEESSKLIKPEKFEKKDKKPPKKKKERKEIEFKETGDKVEKEKVEKPVEKKEDKVQIEEPVEKKEDRKEVKVQIDKEEKVGEEETHVHSESKEETEQDDYESFNRGHKRGGYTGGFRGGFRAGFRGGFRGRARGRGTGRGRGRGNFNLSYVRKHGETETSNV